MKCEHKGTCSTCPYDYCIDENAEPKETPDRSTYFSKYYENNRAKVNEAHRKAYKAKKLNGICVRCDKKATNGLYCRECSIKQKERSAMRAQGAKRSRHAKGLIPEARKNEGQCLWCGAEATGGTMACDRHRKIFKEASLRGDKSFWKQQRYLEILMAGKKDGK